jgi:hypothetical protein
MAFNHQQYVNLYVQNANNGGQPINDAADYGVRIMEAAIPEGEVYWRVIGIHHLYPRENFGNHHVYLEAVDENGQRIKNPYAWAGWTWEGRQPGQRADPVILDKPPYEAAGNIALHIQQTVEVWIKGLSPTANEPSDHVANLHTRHPDEPLEDGSLLNSIGHHSFYVVFQRSRKGPPPVDDGVISGQVVRGGGYRVRLLKNDQTVGMQVIAQDESFKFENLSYGTYKVQVVDTNVEQDNIRLDANNKAVYINLVVPPVTKSSVFGKVANGVGKTLLLIKQENIIARQVIPPNTEYRFVNLAPGIYSLQVFGTAVRQDNIALDGTNTREVNLTVPEPEQPEKTIPHYVLFGPPGSRGLSVNWQLAGDYIQTFALTAGFSVAEAKAAQFVTIIGEGVSEEEQNEIEESGSQVEILVGDAYNIEAELQQRINNGNARPPGS